MNKLVLLVVLLAGAFSIAYGQQKVIFSGEVRDDQGAPLEFANVIAIDTVKKTMAAFAVTNPQGQFKISLEKDRVYTIKVSFIGFLPFERTYKAEESNSTPFGIGLTTDAQQLGDVEVVSEMPVLIQGDTITYKAEVFTQGNERKLGDVLKDLPGFEVDADGGVKVQGKSVDKVLVDGKEFFEGDTKLATKNLPANVVDRVQVLQNFNDISPLRGVNNSEQLALNIQLKEDKKSMVFGDLKLGGGPEGRYLAHVNTFYYDKKTNINLIADANNVGIPAFSMSDYFRFSGGLGGFSRGAGSSIQTTSNQLGIPMAERNNAKSLKNELGALSYNFTPSNKWQINGFAIGSRVDNTLGSISQRTYVLQPGNNTELLTSEQQVESTSGLFKYGIKYMPNPNLQVDYSGFGRLASIENLDFQNSTFGNQSNDINGTTTQEPYSIQQQLRAFWAATNKDIWSFEGSYSHEIQDPTYNLVNSGQPFASIIPMTGNSPYNLTQLRYVATNKYESALNYYRILNKTNHVNFKLGSNSTSQTLNSSMYETLDDGTVNEFSQSNLVNLVDYTFEDYYLGILYKTKFGPLEMSPSLNLHRYKVWNNQNDSQNGFDKTMLLPGFSARYQFRSSHTLNLNYAVTAEFTDVQNFAEALVVRSYNSLFRGNTDLKNSLYHSLNLRYFNFNMYNFLNLYGGLNYSKRLDDVSNIVQFNNLERVNSPININAANEVMSGYASFDKRLDAFRFNLSANWSRSTSNNIISDTPNQNVSFNQSYKATITTTLFKKLYLDFGYSLALNNYEARNTTSQFETHQPFGNLEIGFLKGFTLNANYEYNSYVSSTNPTQTFDLLDAELRYRKEGSPWEFKVEGMNLLNTTGIRRDSFSESLISTFEYFIQKRYWVFSVMYDL
jgi:hypothetical protein